jgi:hypothetical protein
MSSTSLRPLLLGLAILGALAPSLIAAPAEAKGWQEMHQTSDDVRVSIEPDGTALVQHHMRYRVVAGHFATIDLPGVVEGAEPLPDAVVASEKTGEVEAHLETHPKEERTLRVVIDAPKGLRRGSYVVDVRYRVNLVAAKQLARDGAMWRLAWTTPAAPEGHDSVRVVFDLPAAATEPRLVVPATQANEPVVDTTMSTLRRGSERDELELVRAHVARGEALTWAVRVDPRALSKLSGEVATSGQPAAAVGDRRPPPNRAPLALAACALALLAVAIAKLSRAKAEAVVRASHKMSASPRPLVPAKDAGLWSLVAWPRHMLYGALAVGAFAALALGWIALGAAASVALLALGTYRVAPASSSARGPGRWLPTREDDAFKDKHAPWDGAWVDASTWRGRAALVALLTVAAGACAALWMRATPVGASLALVALSLVPLWITGTRRSLPVSPRRAARVLAPLVTPLRGAGLAVRPVGRYPICEDGTSADLDEVRLRVTSSRARPGFGAVEITAVSPTWMEVFVRVRDGSPAAARLAEIAPDHAVVCGRTPDERVMTLVPEQIRDVASFVERLVRSLDLPAEPAAHAGASVPAVPEKLAA